MFSRVLPKSASTQGEQILGRISKLGDFQNGPNTPTQGRQSCDRDKVRDEESPLQSHISSHLVSELLNSSQMLPHQHGSKSGISLGIYWQSAGGA